METRSALAAAISGRYPEGVAAPDDVHSRTVGFRELGALLDAAPADPVARLLTAE